MADPRQTLQDLIRRFGTALAEDPQRCKGMLRDLCGSSKREIAGLVAAIEEKIPIELIKPHPILVSLRANMIIRLENHRGLAHDVAVWTVDTWGLVLGTWTQEDLDKFSPLPGSSAPPPRPTETVIDLSGVVVDSPNLDRTQDLALTATERQKGVKKTIVLLDSGKRLEVTLPAGIKVGQRLRLQGEGARDAATGAVGDLYLVVKEQAPSQVATPQAPKTASPVPSSSPAPGVSNLTNKGFDLPNNGGRLELIEVPRGTLVMKAGHRVNLKPFWIGKYPVTQRQYQAVIGKNPSHFKGNLECPVENVNWYDAITFCQKLSQRLGKTIDLPSETMWEWAARGATKSKGYTYAGSNNLEGVGWYDKNSGKTTHPVGQKQPNELGLYDMSGNVWEWCMDNWIDSVNVLPQNGTALTQGGDSSYRAVRGGSWINYPEDCRCARRFRYDPCVRGNIRGFRVVLSVSAL
jgi:formylglycine-generating enzyme required for sulfatase activity